MDFFQTSGHFFFGTTVNDVNFFRTHSLGASCSVHSYVAAADNSNSFAMADRCVVIGNICFHQVDTSQVFVSGVYAYQCFAGDTHEGRQTCAGTDEYSIITHIFDDFVDGQNFADNHVCHNFYAHGREFINFFLHDRLRQTEFGDTVNQYTASCMECFENGYRIAFFCQVASTCQRRRTGTDNGNFLAVLSGFSGHFIAVCHVPVSHETFQTTDGNGFAFDGTHAFRFALTFLRTYTTADSRQSVCGSDDLISCHKVAFCYFRDEFGNAYVYGTSADTGFVFAVQTAGSFFHGHFRCVAHGYFFKVFISHIRCLFRHFDFFQAHVCHCFRPP